MDCHWNSERAEWVTLPKLHPSRTHVLLLDGVRWLRTLADGANGNSVIGLEDWRVLRGQTALLQ